MNYCPSCGYHLNCTPFTKDSNGRLNNWHVGENEISEYIAPKTKVHKEKRVSQKLNLHVEKNIPPHRIIR